MKSLRFIFTGILPVILIATVSLGSCTSNRKTEIDKFLPRAETSPALAQAMDSVWAQAEKQGIRLQSVMVVQHDSVIYEHWANGAHPDSLHILYSVSKTFTSLGVGFAIADSLLSLDTKIVDIFPDCLPDSVSDNLREITVENLLTMSCGHAHEHFAEICGLAESDSTLCWARQFLSYPVEYKPGTVFTYNTLGTFMLSAAIQRLSGQKLIDYLTPRLFEPLGIEGAVWEENNEGINLGGTGLYLKTEDLAKVGQLLLDRGEWHGQRIVDPEWIDQMSARHIQSVQGTPNSIEFTPSEEDLATSDWVQGYGYQLWRCRHNAYRADGSLGQFIVVMPEIDAVVAMTADSHTYQSELNLVWDYILPVISR